MKKRVITLLLLAAAMAPRLALAWEESLIMNENISEFDCNGAPDLFWREDGGDGDIKHAGSDCTVQVGCGWDCGSKGGRCFAKKYVSSSTSGKRYRVTGVSGTGDWSGVDLQTETISGTVYSRTSHVEHNEPGSVMWTYVTELWVHQTYIEPSGFTLTDPADAWHSEGSGPLATITAPNQLQNGTNLVAVSYTGSGEVSSGDGNSVTITRLSTPTTINWTYRVAYPVALGVSCKTAGQSAPTAGQHGLQPHSGTAMVPILGSPMKTSVIRGILTGGDRYYCIGWTNGGGDVAASGQGTYEEATGRLGWEINLTQSNRLTWVYEYQNLIDISVSPTDPPEVWTYAAPRVNAVAAPANGDVWIEKGSAATCVVTPSFEIQGQNYILQSWTGAGDAPASGSSNSTTFTVNQLSSLLWSYRKAYQVAVDFVMQDGSAVPNEVRNGGHSSHVPPATDPPQLFATGPNQTYTAVLSITNVLNTGIRYACVGWTGIGDVPSSGTGNTIANVPVTQNSRITWIYQRQNRLRIEVLPPERAAGASPNPTGDTWYAANAEVTANILINSSDNGSNYVCLGSQVVSTGPMAANSVQTIVGDRFQRKFQLDADALLTWRFDALQDWVVGEPIQPPAGANANVRPTLELVVPGDPVNDTAFNVVDWYGSTGDKHLYPVRPIASAVLRWQDATNPAVQIIVGGRARWPDEADIQRHIGLIPVDLQPPSSGYIFHEVKYTTGDATITNRVFHCGAGRSVLVYVEGSDPDPTKHPVLLDVVDTFDIVNTPGNISISTGWTIGKAITNEYHNDPGRNGFIFYEKAYYDASIYNRTTREGPIIPVNKDKASVSKDDMVIAWYQPGLKTNFGIYWPVLAGRYNCRWPDERGEPCKQIVIASQKGSYSLSGNIYRQPSVYYQNDTNRPGHNPNEEHAFLAPSDVGLAVFALRNDLNIGCGGFSQPYVLLKYRDVLMNNEWAMEVYKVQVTDASNDLHYAATAGLALQPPYPLTVLPPATGSVLAAGALWHHRDHKGGHWAKASTGDTNNPAQITMHWYYPLQTGWVFPDYDGDGQPDAAEGVEVPWLNIYAGGLDDTDPPVDVLYDVRWPTTEVAVLNVGETLMSSKRGLPDVKNMAAAEVIFDEYATFRAQPVPSLVRLIDPLSERYVKNVTATVLGSILLEDGEGGRKIFPELPYSIKSRLTYDPINKWLYFKGTLDESGAGEPLLLLNVMTTQERDRIKQLDGEGSNTPFDDKIEELYQLTRNPYGLDLSGGFGGLPDGLPDEDVLVGLEPAMVQSGTSTVEDIHHAVPEKQLGPKALTAGAACSTGYVTLVENDDPVLGAAPVALHVIRVAGGPYVGEIKVINSDNVFDEKLTLRHSGDFGGDADIMEFEWYYQPDTTGFAPPLPAGDDTTGWTLLKRAFGANDVTIEGASLLTISDNWIAMRYRYLNAYPFMPQNNWYSLWCGAPGGDRAQLAEGWIKRVVRGLNPFDARVQAFHKAATATYVSMVQQAGTRYEGPIALNNNPCNINNVGLIEAYETVLRRGEDFSINAGYNYGPANNALLNAASRIADLYSLLGNEAYADAQDPTIGFGTDSGEYGTLAPTIFAFQNQVDSLLEEELVLLRGRDSTAAPVNVRPVFNRLYPNFTSGEGEVAYQQAYNIQDQMTVDSDGDFCLDEKDGVIDEIDAFYLFPQGHGDAWGHYLTGLKAYYKLLREPNYTWEPRAESVLVANVPILVDYLDERKFAKLAAAKARTGSEIVNLTYRQKYVADVLGQWQGYKDTDADRAWGVTEWARRAGQAAYLDWVVANALLPAEDTHPGHTGISKIDRTRIDELDEIVAQGTQIQGQMDRADAGLNPLGLVNGVVPFDINPGLVTDALPGQEKTHFEQIYDRAVKAMENSYVVFDYVNKLTLMLRRVQDKVNEFTQAAKEQELDYKNRLIEIFGYPYAGDIGAGKTYPSGYDGPDLYHYMYVDAIDIVGSVPAPSDTFRAFFEPFPQEYKETVQNKVGTNGVTDFVTLSGFYFTDDYLTSDTNATFESLVDADWEDTIEVQYPTRAADYAFQAPEEWGRRRAQGELQRALSDLLREQISLKIALGDYDGRLKEIEDQLELLKAQFDVGTEKLRIMNKNRDELLTMDMLILTAYAAATAAKRTADIMDKTSDAIIEGLPKIIGALGMDVAAPIRGLTKGTSLIGETGFKIIGDVADVAQKGLEIGKADLEKLNNISIEVASQQFEVLQRVKAIELLMINEVTDRLAILNQREAMHQASEDFLTKLAEGQRLLEERMKYRKNAAAVTQNRRYEDMAFRIFRNDALQKYRAQFDLAAKYVFLAAKAYDYETNLLRTDGNAGQAFLTDIIRQRSLGEFSGGEPRNGRGGLADPLARLGINFSILKPQLGFSNPQTETGRFSLRGELFRLRDASAVTWRQMIEKYRVDDLWSVPQFRRFCRPFASEDQGAQPGLVIPFTTTITFDLNFFGWPLSGGDSSYDTTHFATKVRSVGLWFENYDGSGLSVTPRVYLVPTGADVMRSPVDDGSLATREWLVVDQKLPEPFPVGASDLETDSWIPVMDTLNNEFAEIRKFSRFRAYHDSGVFSEDEMVSDSRLIGRSVWNTQWLLIIPGGTFLADANEGLDTFINGRLVPGGGGVRDGNGVSDIRLFFQTYAYSGN